MAVFRFYLSQGDGNRKSFPVILIIVWLCIVGSFFYLGYRSYKKIERIKTWPTTEGIVLEGRLDYVRGTGSRGATYKPYIRYRYTLRGRTYTNDDLGPFSYSSSLKSRMRKAVKRYPVGSRVRVYYNPQDPQESYLDPGWGMFVVYILWGIGAFFLVIGRVIYTLHKRKNSHYKSSPTPSASDPIKDIQEKLSEKLSPENLPKVIESATKISFWVLVLLSGFLIGAWFSFYRIGQRLQELGEKETATAVMLVSALVYGLVIFWLVRARRMFLEDLRAGRIMRIPLRHVDTRNSSEDPFSSEGVSPDGFKYAYRIPRTSRWLWFMLFLALGIGFLLHNPVFQDLFIRGVGFKRVERYKQVNAIQKRSERVPYQKDIKEDDGSFGVAKEIQQTDHSSQRTNTEKMSAVSEDISRGRDFAEFINEIRAELSPCPELLGLKYDFLSSASNDQLENTLHDVLLCKITRSTYQRAKANRDRKFLLDKGQPFPEEELIRKLRDILAARRVPPPETKIYTVSSYSDSKPRVTIDGLIGEKEWKDALWLPVPGTKTSVYLKADKQFLYMAVSVPEETTPASYSSMRVIMHEALSPWIQEEYVFVYGGGYVGSGCRISELRWPEPSPTGGWPHEERWKNYRLNECGLFPETVGDSAIDGKRIYELRLDRKSTGLGDFPVPISLEIEIAPDPVTGERRYVGPMRPGIDRWGVWIKLP